MENVIEMEKSEFECLKDSTFAIHKTPYGNIYFGLIVFADQTAKNSIEKYCSHVLLSQQDRRMTLAQIFTKNQCRIPFFETEVDRLISWANRFTQYSCAFTLIIDMQYEKGYFWVEKNGVVGYTSVTQSFKADLTQRIPNIKEVIKSNRQHS